MTHNIPLIDISSWNGGSNGARDRVAASFGAACETWGFAMIEGHGVDPLLIEAIRDVTRRFFDLPDEEKLAVSATGRPGGRGYYRLASKSHARTLGDLDAPGDLREAYFCGMEPIAGDPYTTASAATAHFAPNAWPARPREMEEVWMDYIGVCGSVASELLRIGARALSLPDDWFDDKVNRPVSTLAAQHYPAQTSPPEPGQVRSGAHTDFGTLTLLQTEDRPGGLQVQNLEGHWIDVRPRPGAFIVNIGDMMAQWTNDRWRSTLHRVVNPPAEAGAAARRLSIVYFHTPNHDAVIQCAPTCSSPDNPRRYPSVLAGKHHAEKLRLANSVEQSREKSPD